MSDGIEQDIRRLTFGQESIRELKASGLLSRRRDNENGDLGFQLLHFPGNLCARFTAEKVVGDYQLDGVLLEKLEGIFRRVSGQHLVADAVQQQFLDA